MAIQDQIIELFNLLEKNDKILILKELHQVNMKSNITINTAPVDSCPYCSSSLILKNGHRSDSQRYKCKVCYMTFTSNSWTSFHGIKKIVKFEEYWTLMFQQYLPIHIIAKQIGISIQTAFDWRHKILSGLNANTEAFNGITEIDDIWFLYSQKGRQGLKYSRKQGSSKRQGDNKFQVKLLVTADRESNKDLSVAKIGRITKSDIERKVGGKFNSSCTLVSDKHRIYQPLPNQETSSMLTLKRLNIQQAVIIMFKM
ncbi:MAG: IS1595 family transposase [Bacteroidota bacterium]